MIDTNLTPEELELLSKGLAKKAQEMRDEIQPENQAEKELFRRVDGVFKQFLDNLQDEIASILRS